MTAITMQAGRIFGPRSAAPLTFLNFTWSAGALAAPLLAARFLLDHTFRAAYMLLACAAFLAAVTCWLRLDELPEPAPAQGSPIRNLRFMALFAVLTFLEVGIENTAGSWLSTYVLRSSGSGEARAAVFSSVFWFGFLASRGLSSLLLLRVEPGRMLRAAIFTSVAAAVALLALPGISGHFVAMMILGAALAPIFPLLLSSFFVHARQSSDSRWVLSLCGFGGSVLPWLTGWISARSGSLRFGLITLPGALLSMIALLPLLAAWTTSLRAASRQDFS